MNNIGVVAVSAMLYVLLVFAVGLIFWNGIKRTFMVIKLHKRLRSRKDALRTRGRVERHLEILLQVTVRGRLSIRTFGFILFVIFAAVGFVSVKNYTAGLAAVIAVIITALPVLAMELRLGSIRRRSSYEGESFIGGFLSKYRISNFNVYEAMEKTAMDNNNSKICSGFMYAMLMSLRNTGRSEEIKQITEIFAASINTNWSRMLGYNIAMSASKGTNIAAALEDILIQLREARALTEERKRLNAEASRMVLFLIPVLYLSSVFMAVKYMEMSISQFFSNQFFTETGFMMLLVAVFLYLINLMFVELVNNQKFDF